MASATANGRGARLPRATILVVVAALVVAASPQAGAALVYDRALILHGEWWRIVTGHWVHFSLSHLFWNLVVLVPAGAWVERLAPHRTRVLFLLSPLVIGVVLFAADPALQRYAGFSGVAAAVLALLALTQLAAGHPDRWFWRTVLGMIAVKIAAELALGRPGFAHFSDTSIRPVPLAHLAGVACACAVHFRGRRRRQPTATGGLPK